MRRSWAALTAIALIADNAPALAQTLPAASGFNLSWAALDPGSDWAATVIRNVFPISGSGGVSTTQTAVIGQMVGQLTGFVAAIAMAFLCYSTIMQIHRGAETSRLLANNMTSMFIVRLGFAAVMMFPVPSLGFSVGQAAVVQMSLLGIGMAKAVYTNAIQALGPGGEVLAQPMIPGTETIVLGLVQNELCRSLINAASNTLSGAGSQLVPEPAGVTIGAGNDVQTVFSYALSVGNVGSAPACGTVTIPAPMSGATNLAGVPVDQSAIQKTVLANVLSSDIASPVENIAVKYFADRQAADLTALQSVLTSATQDYTRQLTAQAVSITQALNASIASSNVATLASGTGGNATQLTALGWSGAGAYYLEFARLNGQTLSLLSAVPQITPPSYQGLGPALSDDLAPLVQSSQAYMTTLTKYVDTQDGVTEPGGDGDLFAGATPGQDGSSIVDQIFRRLHLNDYMLQAIQKAIAPSGGSGWVDPFGALMTLGNLMVATALAAMGLAAIASSATASAATSIFSVLTGNVAAAGGMLAAHSVMSFLGTPIFLLLLGLLIPGMTISFVLPMIPWVMWMAGVMGWLILVCEAVIAVPLWMLAHMTMEGEGLHGRANEGYALIFNVLFRPTLMIFGLFLGYFVFSSMSWLIRQTFGVAAGFVLEHGWMVTNVIGVIVLLSIFVMTHVTAALMSFRMISLIPHHLPRLLGFSSAGRVDMDEFSRDAAIVGVAKTITGIEGGLYGGLQQAGVPQLQQSPRQLAGPNTGNQQGGSASKGSASGGMDTTLRSTTDMPSAGEREENGADE